MLNNQRELHERMTSVIQRLPVSTSGSIAKTTNKKPTALQEVSSRVNTINDDVRLLAGICQQLSFNLVDTLGYLQRQNENLPQLLRSAIPSTQTASQVKVVRTVDEATYRKAKVSKRLHRPLKLVTDAMYEPF